MSIHICQSPDVNCNPEKMSKVRFLHNLALEGLTLDFFVDEVKVNNAKPVVFNEATNFICIEEGSHRFTVCNSLSSIYQSINMRTFNLLKGKDYLIIISADKEEVTDETQDDGLVTDEAVEKDSMMMDIVNRQETSSYDLQLPSKRIMMKIFEECSESPQGSSFVSLINLSPLNKAVLKFNDKKVCKSSTKSLLKGQKVPSQIYTVELATPIKVSNPTSLKKEKKDKDAKLLITNHAKKHMQKMGKPKKEEKKKEEKKKEEKKKDIKYQIHAQGTLSLKKGHVYTFITSWNEEMLNVIVLQKFINI
jgi:hypothetical protein